MVAIGAGSLLCLCPSIRCGNCTNVPLFSAPVPLDSIYKAGAMVQTAHFAGQTNLLVPRCFNLMHSNSIKIGRIDGSGVPGCALPGFAVRLVEKPVRTYRLGHVNRNAKGRKRDIFAYFAAALRVKTERRFVSVLGCVLQFAVL